MHRHQETNRREHIHRPRTTGERLADTIASKVGSWPFILIQSFLLILWIALNVIAWVHHWDAYPFILLNLCLSFQAAYTGPIVLLSQNRQGAKDRVRDTLEADEIQAIYDANELLMSINKRQLELITILHEHFIDDKG